MINLNDTTLVIATRIDNQDRIRNLKLIIDYITRYFNIQILIYEYDSATNIPKDIYGKENVKHILIQTNDSIFYRTKCINEGFKLSKTDFFGIYDADVLLKPIQYVNTITMLRNNEADVVYPYDGRFLNVLPKDIPIIIDTLTLDFVDEKECPQGLGMPELSSDRQSFGGATFFNRRKFIEGGMANENIIGYGPDDAEIVSRFRKLEYRLKRIDGPLFHLTHQKTSESEEKHPFAQKNHDEFRKVFSMKKEALREYVNSWPWCKFADNTNLETAGKIGEANSNEEAKLLEILKTDFRNVPALLRLAEIELHRSNFRKAENYLIAVLALNAQNVKAKALWERLKQR